MSRESFINLALEDSKAASVSANNRKRGPMGFVLDRLEIFGTADE